MEVSTSVPVKAQGRSTTPQTPALTSTANPRKRKTPPCDENDVGTPAPTSTTVVVVDQDGDGDVDDLDGDADADADAEVDGDVEPNKQGTEEQEQGRRDCRHCSPDPHDAHTHSPQSLHHSRQSHSPSSPSIAPARTHSPSSVPVVEPHARLSSSSASASTAAPPRPVPGNGDVPGQGEYEKGHVVCEICNSQVSFRDEETGVFSLDQWNLHRKKCTGQSQGATGRRSPGPTGNREVSTQAPFTRSTPPGPSQGHPQHQGQYPSSSSSPSVSTRSRHPPSPHSYRPHPGERERQREMAMYNNRPPHVQTRSATSLAHLQSARSNPHLQPHAHQPHSPPASLSHPHPHTHAPHTSLTTLVHESLAQTPLHPPTKRRRAKRTEEERIAYLREDPYVAKFEPYKVLCGSCDKWIRLRPNSTYCSIPWDAHRKSCLSKKISNKNTYALEERNSLFAKDHDIRKFDAERVLCAVCDQWIPINPEDHLQAVQTWIAHRGECAKRHAGIVASGVGLGGVSVGPSIGRGSLSPLQRATHTMPSQGSPVLPPLMAQDQRDRHALFHAHVQATSRSQHLPPRSFPPGQPRHPRENPHEGAPSERPGLSRSSSGGVQVKKQEMDEDLSVPLPVGPSRTSGVDISDEGSDADADADVDADADADADIDADGDPDVVPLLAASASDRERERELEGNVNGRSKSAEEQSLTPRGHGIRHSRSPPGGHPPPQHQHAPTPTEILQQQQQEQQQHGEVIYSPAAGIFPPGPAHESRRRNAEQRAATLRADKLIKQVEANRVFCRLCEKWVQLRQDSSYCAYPWLQHRGKCLARYQRRAQKAVEIAEIKARRAAGLAHGHGHPGHGGVPPSSIPPNAHHREDYPSSHGPSPSLSHASHRPHPSHGPFSASKHEQYIPHPSSMSQSPRYPRNYVPGRDQDDDELMSDGDFPPLGISPGMQVMSMVDLELSDEEDFPEDHLGDEYSRFSQISHRRERERERGGSIGSGDEEFGVNDEDHDDERLPSPPMHRSRSHSQTGNFSSMTVSSRAQSQSQKMEYVQREGKQGRRGISFGSGGRQQERSSRSRAANSGNEADPDDVHGVEDEGVAGDGEQQMRRGEDDVEMDVDGEDEDGDLESSNQRIPQRSSRHRDPHASANARYPSRTRYSGPSVGPPPSQRQHQLVAVQSRGGYPPPPPPPPAGPRGYPPQHQYGFRDDAYRPRSSRSHQPHGTPYVHGPMPSGSHTSASFAGNVAGGMPRRAGGSSIRALADLDSDAGRKQFVSHSISYLFQTTYEPSDELSISALLTYLNAAMPVDKHEDFDTAEVVRAVVALQQKGKILFEGDLVKRIRNE